jgi:hypothetical protein
MTRVMLRRVTFYLMSHKCLTEGAVCRCDTASWSILVSTRGHLLTEYTTTVVSMLRVIPWGQSFFAAAQ